MEVERIKRFFGCRAFLEREAGGGEGDPYIHGLVYGEEGFDGFRIAPRSDFSLPQLGESLLGDALDMLVVIGKGRNRF